MIDLPFQCTLPLLSSHEPASEETGEETTATTARDVEVEVQCLGYRVDQDSDTHLKSYFWRTDTNGSALHPFTVGFHSTVIFGGKLFEQTVEIQMEQKSKHRVQRPIFRVYLILGVESDVRSSKLGQLRRMAFQGKTCQSPWKVICEYFGWKDISDSAYSLFGFNSKEVMEAMKHAECRRELATVSGTREIIRGDRNDIEPDQWQSLVAAHEQDQQRTIARMERKVSALRKRLARCPNPGPASSLLARESASLLASKLEARPLPAPVSISSSTTAAMASDSETMPQPAPDSCSTSTLKKEQESIRAPESVVRISESESLEKEREEQEDHKESTTLSPTRRTKHKLTSSTQDDDEENGNDDDDDTQITEDDLLEKSLIDLTHRKRKKQKCSNDAQDATYSQQHIPVSAIHPMPDLDNAPAPETDGITDSSEANMTTITKKKSDEEHETESLREEEIRSIEKSVEEEQDRGRDGAAKQAPPLMHSQEHSSKYQSSSSSTEAFSSDNDVPSPLRAKAIALRQMLAENTPCLSPSEHNVLWKCESSQEISERSSGSSVNPTPEAIEIVLSQDDVHPNVRFEQRKDTQCHDTKVASPFPFEIDTGLSPDLFASSDEKNSTYQSQKDSYESRSGNSSSSPELFPSFSQDDEMDSIGEFHQNDSSMIRDTGDRDEEDGSSLLSDGDDGDEDEDIIHDENDDKNVNSNNDDDESKESRQEDTIISMDISSELKAERDENDALVIEEKEERIGVVSDMDIHGSIEFSDEASLFGENRGMFSPPTPRHNHKDDTTMDSLPNKRENADDEDSQDLANLLSRSPQYSQRSGNVVSPPELRDPATGLLSSTNSSYLDEFQLSLQDLPNQPIQAINSRNPLSLQAMLDTGNLPIMDIDFCTRECKILVCSRSKVSIYEMSHGEWKILDYHITSTQREQFFKARFTPEGGAIAIAASIEPQHQDTDECVLESCIRFYGLDGRGVKKGEDLAHRPYLCHLSLDHQGKVNDMTFIEWQDALLTVSDDGTFLCTKMQPDWTDVVGHRVMNTSGPSDGDSRVSALEYLSVTDIPTVVVGCTHDRIRIFDVGSGTSKTLLEAGSFRILQTPVFVEKVLDGSLACIIVHSPLDDTESDTTSNGVSSASSKRLCGRFLLTKDGVACEKTYTGRGRSCDDVIAIAATRFYFAAGCMDGSVSIFNSRTGKCVAILVDMEKESLTACKFHEDLPFFACGGANGTLCIYVQAPSHVGSTLAG